MFLLFREGKQPRMQENSAICKTQKEKERGRRRVKKGEITQQQRQTKTNKDSDGEMKKKKSISSRRVSLPCGGAKMNDGD